MRKLSKLFFLFLLILTSCSYYKLSNEEISAIELEDNNLCIKEGTNYNPEDTRTEYWKCRLRIVNQRIYVGPDVYDGYPVAYKAELNRMRREIKKRIKEINKKSKFEIANFSEEKEHNYCILLKNRQEGHGDETYNYYKCREKIKNLRKNKDNYSELTNETIYEIFKIEEEIKTKKSSNVILIQNECVKYASSVEKLEKCEQALEKIGQCSLGIKKTLDQRQVYDTQFCRKVSIEKYPDSLAKFDNAATTVNLGPKVSKIDLVNLREQTFNDCKKQRDLKLEEYNNYLKDQCRITNFKILEEK